MEITLKANLEKIIYISVLFIKNKENPNLLIILDILDILYPFFLIFLIYTCI